MANIILILAPPKDEVVHTADPYMEGYKTGFEFGWDEAMAYFEEHGAISFYDYKNEDDSTATGNPGNAAADCWENHSLMKKS